MKTMDTDGEDRFLSEHLQCVTLEGLPSSQYQGYQLTKPVQSISLWKRITNFFSSLYNQTNKH